MFSPNPRKVKWQSSIISCGVFSIPRCRTLDEDCCLPRESTKRPTSRHLSSEQTSPDWTARQIYNSDKYGSREVSKTGSFSLSSCVENIGACRTIKSKAQSVREVELSARSPYSAVCQTLLQKGIHRGHQYIIACLPAPSNNCSGVEAVRMTTDSLTLLGIGRIVIHETDIRLPRSLANRVCRQLRVDIGVHHLLVVDSDPVC